MGKFKELAIEEDEVQDGIIRSEMDDPYIKAEDWDYL